MLMLQILKTRIKLGKLHSAKLFFCLFFSVCDVICLAGVKCIPPLNPIITHALKIESGSRPVVEWESAQSASLSNPSHQLMVCMRNEERI